MRNLNEKIQAVDIGVAICIDGILRHTATLQNENLDHDAQKRLKAKIRQNAETYKKALDELLEALDDRPATKNTTAENAPKCTACGIDRPEIEQDGANLAISFSIPFIYDCIRAQSPNWQALNDGLIAMIALHKVYNQQIEAQLYLLEQNILGGDDE